MKKASISKNEKERLEALKSYDLLDSPEELIFDSLTKLTARIFDVPYCIISITDSERQWFKSCFGWDAKEASRDISFCAHAINSVETLIVPDARLDERFNDNPYVTGESQVIFYAGHPLIDMNGHALGTLCIIDNKPRSFSQSKFEELIIIAEQVVYLIQSRKEKAIKEKTQNFLSKISENIPGVIYTFKVNVDGTKCVPFTSPQMQSIFEVDLEEILSDATPIFSRIHPNDIEMVNLSIAHSAKKMNTWVCEYRIVLPNKSEKWIRGRANPERELDGSILWHGYINDITEMKMKEEIHKQSGQMAFLGEMSAGIAHEINNPLSIIIGSLNLLSKNINDAEKNQKAIQRIQKSADRITKIVRGLKKYSRSSSGREYKIHKLSEIVQEAVELTEIKAKNEDIFVKVDIKSDSQILCDEIEIEQVLINFINNAIDAISSFEQRWINIELYDDDQFINLRIIDSGPGIPEEIQRKMFDPFYTTKEVGKGTGLGLSISKGILEQHKASINIITNLPNTCFEIRFPVNKLRNVA